MDLRIDKIDGVAVVSIPISYLDAGNHEEFLRDISSVLDSNKNVVFDFSDIRFVDSSGIGAILYSQRRLDAVGGRLNICCVCERVQESFDHLRMHRLIGLFATRDEAITSFKNAAQ